MDELLILTDPVATQAEPGFLGWTPNGAVFKAPKEPAGPVLGPARMAAAIATPGALWWPRANTTIQRAPVDGGIMLDGPGKGLWHTTETSTWPGYSNNVHPHLTVHLEGGRFAARQHIPFTRAARALRNEAGGVQTNRLVRCQVEIVTRADIVDERGLPAAMEDGLGELAAWLAAQWGVPMVCTVRFKTFPASYGRNNGVRLSPAGWQRYRGWCGHMHPPENEHGDPGLIDAARILGGDDMPLDAGDLAKIDAIAKKWADLIYNGRDPKDGSDLPDHGVSLVAVRDRFISLAGQVEGLAEPGPVVVNLSAEQLDQLAVKVAERLAGGLFHTSFDLPPE